MPVKEMPVKEMSDLKNGAIKTDSLIGFFKNIPMCASAEKKIRTHDLLFIFRCNSNP